MYHISQVISRAPLFETKQTVLEYKSHAQESLQERTI